MKMGRDRYDLIREDNRRKFRKDIEKLFDISSIRFNASIRFDEGLKKLDVGLGKLDKILANLEKINKRISN